MQNAKFKMQNAKLVLFFQNRQWLGYFCALRSDGKRSILNRM